MPSNVICVRIAMEPRESRREHPRQCPSILRKHPHQDDETFAAHWNKGESVWTMIYARFSRHKACNAHVSCLFCSSQEQRAKCLTLSLHSKTKNCFEGNSETVLSQVFGGRLWASRSHCWKISCRGYVLEDAGSNGMVHGE